MLEKRGEKIVNESACTNPAAISFRITSMRYTKRNYLLAKVAKEHGVDIKPFSDEVQHISSTQSARAYRSYLKDPTDVGEYVGSMFNQPNALDSYDIELVELSHDRAVVEFHYCPLVKAWQECGASLEEIGDLCLSAMHGDEIMAAEMGFDLDIQKTIGCGHDCCRMVYTARKGADNGHTPDKTEG